jgi:hypothetical protein
VTIQSESALPASLRDQWPYAPHYANVNGWRMQHIDEREGGPVVLLHGNPTWGSSTATSSRPSSVRGAA